MAYTPVFLLLDPSSMITSYQDSSRPMEINILVFLRKSSMSGFTRENAIICSHTWRWGPDPPDNLHCYWLKPPKQRLRLVETRVLRMLSCSSGALRWVAALTQPLTTQIVLYFTASQDFTTCILFASI